jgi:hypothetical protein
MGARNPIDNMTLFEAYRIQLGGRPAGGTRTLRDPQPRPMGAAGESSSTPCGKRRLWAAPGTHD